MTRPRQVSNEVRTVLTAGDIYPATSYGGAHMVCVTSMCHECGLFGAAAG